MPVPLSDLPDHLVPASDLPSAAPAATTAEQLPSDIPGSRAKPAPMPSQPSGVRQAFQEGFGEAPVGISDQTYANLQALGVFPPNNPPWYDPRIALANMARAGTYAGEGALRTASGAFRAAQETGLEMGLPRDIVAMPEAFMGTPGELGGALRSAATRMDPLDLTAREAETPPLISQMPKEQQAAVTRVADRLVADFKAGGANPADVATRVLRARQEGTPLSLSDVGDRNVQKLSGVLARSTGPAGTIAGKSLEERLSGAGQRLARTVEEHIANEPTMRQSREALRNEQIATSAPLYEKALAPGSIAPLEKQFEHAFSETSRDLGKAQEERAAAQRELAQALAAESRAGEDVYLNNSALEAKRQAQAKVEAAQAKIDAVRAEHQNNLDLLRQAQQAVANGERGGVWSPYIQRFLKDPLFKEALGPGMQIERLEALAQRRPVNYSDYALNEAGEVIRTPNMKLLNAAKKGIDALIEKYRDPTTGKLNLDATGHAIVDAQKEFVKELDRVNPDYASARQAWSGPARANAAMIKGRNVFKTHPEDVKKIYEGLSPNEQKHFKMGVAEALKDQISESSVTAPAIRKLAKNTLDNSRIKEQVRPLFKNDVEYNRFLDAVTNERKILESRTRYVRGSQSAERLADEQAAAQEGVGQAARLVGHAARRDLPGLVSEAARWVEKRRQLGALSEDAQAHAADFLFDPNIDFSTGMGAALLQEIARRTGGEQ